MYPHIEQLFQLYPRFKAVNQIISKLSAAAPLIDVGVGKRRLGPLQNRPISRQSRQNATIMKILLHILQRIMAKK